MLSTATSSFMAASVIMVMALASGALAQCVTSTETALAFATTVTDVEQFKSSMNQRFSRSEGQPITGATVYIWTSLETYLGSGASPGGSYTAYAIYEAAALTSAGYSITTETNTVSVCTTEASSGENTALPPSLTSAGCSPHGDHWHCDGPKETGDEHPEPTGTGTAACEPHGDHWHCPSGVPEPTSPPKETDEDEDPAETGAASCEPHGDHWHCPSGVPEPTSPPDSMATTKGTTMATSSGAAPASTSGPPFEGDATRGQGAAFVLVVGVVAGLFMPLLMTV